REDLYYRLRVIEIVVPPLRERVNEIPRLFEFFVAKYAKRYNRPEPELSHALFDAIQRHSWPGNIRELENVVKRFVILQDEALLQPDPPASDRSRAAIAAARPAPEPRQEESGAQPQPALAADAKSAGTNGNGAKGAHANSPTMTLA